MKGIKSILLGLLVLMTFSACSDKDLDVPDVVDEGPDYLVMLYSVGGKTLDKPILSNIYQALNVGSSDNVKMTVQFKLSVYEQKRYPAFDGTRRFDLDDNTHLVGSMESAVQNYPIICYADELDKLFSTLNSECIADSLYDMSRSDALADFITWSMKQHPNAKRTVLIINDHGSGWQLTNDGKQDTRAILQDDNTKTIMSLGSVVEGIKKSVGKVDLLYNDACLMSMYENLYGYANCANYLFAAVEITPGAGGNYSVLLNKLKTAGTSNARLETAMHSMADFMVSDQWWTNKKLIEWGYGGMYHDIALYDLSKLDKLTPVLKKVVDTMVEKYNSTESVEPNKNKANLGEQYKGYIRYALTNCQIAYVNDRYPNNYIPEPLLPYIKADSVKMYPDPDGLFFNDYFYSASLVRWLRNGDSENAQKAQEQFPNEWNLLKWFLISYYSHSSFSFTDLLRLTDNSLTEAEAKQNPFKQLKAELIAALKEVGYISCTMGDDKAGIDQAYELCSPGITIVPFNEAYYDKMSNTFMTEIPTHQEALRIYQQTDFDKQVGWSRMLQLIDVFPDMFANPSRDRVDKEDKDTENYDPENYNPRNVWRPTTCRSRRRHDR